MILKQFEQYTDNEIINKIAIGETKLYEILIRRYNSLMKQLKDLGVSEDLIITEQF